METETVAQVPEGLYQTSVSGWENCEEFLHPFYLILRKYGILKE